MDNFCISYSNFYICVNYEVERVLMTFIFIVELSKDTPDKGAVKSLLEKVRNDTEGMLGVAKSLLIHGDDINVNEIGEMVDEELNATQQAIQEGAKKIQVSNSRISIYGNCLLLFISILILELFSSCTIIKIKLFSLSPYVASLVFIFLYLSCDVYFFVYLDLFFYSYY